MIYIVLLSPPKDSLSILGVSRLQTLNRNRDVSLVLEKGLKCHAKEVQVWVICKTNRRAEDGRQS
jgi:hypothetical protein